MIERKVIFENTGSSKESSYVPMPFRIEPPIQVHDPDFIYHALKKRIDESGKHYLVGRTYGEWKESRLRYPIINGATLSFSDEMATYGVISVHENANYVPLVGLIVKSFEEALNPIGRVALEFGSNPDDPNDRFDAQVKLETVSSD